MLLDKTQTLILQVMADPSLSLKQRAFVADAARALDKAKMMRFDEKSGNFYCTELGRIASHFYIRYSSVETYNEMLRRNMNDSEVEFQNQDIPDLETNIVLVILFKDYLLDLDYTIYMSSFKQYNLLMR